VKSLPRSLFLKIFLWFGAVMVTVVAGTFVFGEFMRAEMQRRQRLENKVSEYAMAAAEEYERSGSTALAAYLDRMQRESNIRGFLFDSHLQELTGRRVPADAPELAAQELHARRHGPHSESHGPMVARSAFTGSGQYVLVAEMPPRTGPSIVHPILHVLMMMLIGGLFCYGLARYLTSPVAKLRTATREFASGNLSARVVPGLGKRRDELASLGADFDVMAEKIQSLVDSQRRLLGDISHELRSPLARLNVALELARQRSGAEATTALERIQREAEILNEMIGQLLVLTRLESGAEQLHKTHFDLKPLVQEIVKDADFEARARHRTVKLAIAEESVIDGVPDLIRRAIENVIRNAIHYTAEGTEVEVDLILDSGERAWVGAGIPEGERVLIAVRDHGPGVPDEALSEIFRPFYRVDDARDRETGGVGLGLAIAERAVRLHGGKIIAAHAPGPGGGLIVRISIPTRSAPPATSGK